MNNTIAAFIPSLFSNSLVYDPPVVLTGVSFRTLDLNGREKLARHAPQPEHLAQRIVKEGLAKEAAVISTCNRFEILSVGGTGAGIRSFFESIIGVKATSHEQLYQLHDQRAVRHLYRVSASLDSMVLGEAQILGQVKQAYRQAVQAGSIGAHLHHLFQSTFNVAKKVHSHTEIAQHGVSVSYVAVRLAQQIFSNLGDTTVLIIGSGEMAELSALHLCSHGCKRIIVANRTVERAAELAERFGGVAVALADIERILDQVDIVISSVSVDHPILTRRSISLRGKNKPLFLIDLGLPRNIAPELSELESIYLYNIDDLATIATENRALREAAAQEAELIIEYGLLQFERWRAKVTAQPEIVDLRARVQRICSDEVARVVTKDLNIQEELATKLAYAISQKVAHELTALLEQRLGINSDQELGASPWERRKLVRP